MNGRRAGGITAVSMAHHAAITAASEFKITLILLHNFVTAAAVYQALSIFGKDCGQHRLNSISRLTGGPKLTFVQTHNRNDAHPSRERRAGMALKVELKPHERIIIGNCVVTNTDQRARLLIDGENVPILREKDIMTPETADTPAKLIYLAVQLMYISPAAQGQHSTYFHLLRDIIATMPSAWPIIETINTGILNGDLYRALKEARKLIAFEKKLIEETEARLGKNAA
jgi:flagellar biosynthesis repressor protein FlbT